jgi:hypothetical protein
MASSIMITRTIIDRIPRTAASQPCICPTRKSLWPIPFFVTIAIPSLRPAVGQRPPIVNGGDFKAVLAFEQAWLRDGELIKQYQGQAPYFGTSLSFLSYGVWASCASRI